MTEHIVDCEQAKKHVHDYLQRELTEAELDAITAHIANCDHCEWEYDFESVLNRVIKVSCNEAPPEEIAERILAKIRSIDLNDIKH